MNRSQAATRTEPYLYMPRRVTETLLEPVLQGRVTVDESYRELSETELDSGSVSLDNAASCN